MKQLPKALERNGDLWVHTATKHLVFRTLQDLRQALEATQGLQASRGQACFTIDHAEQLRSLATVEELLGLDDFDRALPPVHDQLGQPSPRQTQLLRNLARLAPI